MPPKEARARIKINKLLEDSGWRFFDNEQGETNILLENHTKISRQQNDVPGDDFEHLSNGFIDYLLLDDKKGFPLIVMEAKREGLHPPVGKEQSLTVSAIIKLFLRTGNARRVLFLVDRLELETQARKNFVKYLKNDYLTLIYKENRDDSRKAEIVATTIQSLLSNNKYKTKFSSTDFDLVISDEAHRNIGGNSRAVF